MADQKDSKTIFVYTAKTPYTGDSRGHQKAIVENLQPLEEVCKRFGDVCVNEEPRGYNGQVGRCYLLTSTDATQTENTVPVMFQVSHDGYQAIIMEGDNSHRPTQIMMGFQEKFDKPYEEMQVPKDTLTVLVPNYVRGRELSDILEK